MKKLTAKQLIQNKLLSERSAENELFDEQFDNQYEKDDIDKIEAKAISKYHEELERKKSPLDIATPVNDDWSYAQQEKYGKMP